MIGTPVIGAFIALGLLEALLVIDSCAANWAERSYDLSALMARRLARTTARSLWSGPRHVHIVGCCLDAALVIKIFKGDVRLG